MPENKRCYVCRREEDELNLLYEEKMIKTSNAYKIAIQKLETKLQEKKYFVDRAVKVQEKILKDSATNVRLNEMLESTDSEKAEPELTDYSNYLNEIDDIINIRSLSETEFSNRSVFDILTLAIEFLQEDVKRLENDLSILKNREIKRDELIIPLNLEVVSAELGQIRKTLYRHEIRDADQLEEFGWEIKEEDSDATYGKFKVYVCWICRSLLETMDFDRQ